MHPRLRFWLIVALGATLGVVVSFGIAEEIYALAVLTIAAIGWFALGWIGGARPEARVIAVALAGYILGNRGFAQLLLSPQLPLLPAEIALLAGAGMVILRMAYRQTTVVFLDGLNLALLTWMALGGVRLWSDFRMYGVLALRDFATVYYALFFFIAQSIAADAPSARLLRRTVLGALCVLPVSYFIFNRFQDVLYQTVQFRGAPLVYYKDDLVAANFFAGFLLLSTVPHWPWLVRGGLALAAYASAFTINSSRAAIMGLLVASGWWLAARRWTPIRLQAVAAPLALSGLALIAALDSRDFKESRLYTLYEHGASIVDFTGTGRYTSEERRYVGDNNRFRLAWWRAVFDETRDANLAFGLGFGADLTSRFLRSYELDLGDEFTTRSPHSIIVTVLGRMGLVGLAAFAWVVAMMVRDTLRLARRARADDAALIPLGWWSVAWVMFTSACFGVVLEGPMGAVVFWTALGMASATTRDLLAKPFAPAATSESAEPPAALAETALT